MTINLQTNVAHWLHCKTTDLSVKWQQKVMEIELNWTLFWKVCIDMFLEFLIDFIKYGHLLSSWLEGHRKWIH